MSLIISSQVFTVTLLYILVLLGMGCTSCKFKMEPGQLSWICYDWISSNCCVPSRSIWKIVGVPLLSLPNTMYIYICMFKKQHFSQDYRIYSERLQKLSSAVGLKNHGFHRIFNGFFGFPQLFDEPSMPWSPWSLQITWPPRHGNLTNTTGNRFFRKTTKRIRDL